MMNLDQVRVGEGVVGAKKHKRKAKDKTPEMDDNKDSGPPSLFESDEQELKIAVPEGWAVNKRRRAGR
jgi:hypothetical protein